VPAFLFEPARVARLLSVLPALRGALPAPAVDSEQARSFPGLKNPREIYRLLANPHYAHLRQSLRAIENGLAARCRFGDLLTTRDYPQFAARMSEVRVADHFLLRDFAVATLPASGARVADLRVNRGDVEATLEVYSPRVWLALADWERTVRDELKNIDEPLDYVASVDTRVLDLAPPPWVIADMLEETGPPLFAELKCDFDAALAARQPYRKVYRHGDYALETQVELDWVSESSGKPGRVIGHGGPPVSGYSPASMFRRIIERQVYGKAGRRQAATATTRLRGLVVDLSRTAGIANDLRQPAHRGQALEVLREVDPTRVGLDFIVFSVPQYRVKPPRQLFVDFNVYENSRVSGAEMEAMFKPFTEPSCE
jgi:hypothetical protein